MLRESFIQNLHSLAEVKKERIRTLVESAKSDLSLLSNMDAVKAIQPTQSAIGDMFSEEAIMTTDITEAEVADNSQVESLLSTIKQSTGVVKIIITDKSGEILLSTDPSDATNIKKEIRVTDNALIEAVNQQASFGNVFRNDGRYFIAVGSPIGDSGNGLTLCFIILDINPLFTEIKDDLGFGETVEVVLAQKRMDIALVLNPLKFDSTDVSVTIGETRGQAIQQAVEGNEGTGYSIDYRGKETLSHWTTVPELNWRLEAKVDMSEINAEAFAVLIKFAIWGAIIIVLAAMVSLLF